MKNMYEILVGKSWRRRTLRRQRGR